MNPAYWVTPLVAAALAAVGYLAKHHLDEKGQKRSQNRADSLALSDALTRILKGSRGDRLFDNDLVMGAVIRARQAAERFNDPKKRNEAIRVIQAVEAACDDETNANAAEVMYQVRELLNRLYDERAKDSIKRRRSDSSLEEGRRAQGS